MPITLTLADDELMQLARYHLLSPCSGHHPASGYWPVHVEAKLQEILTMSQTTQTQAAADAAQLRADFQVFRDHIDGLTQRIADMQAAAQANAGSVPAEVQAAIDEGHAYAQSLQQAQQPASGGDTTGGGDAGATVPGGGDQSAPAGDQSAPAGEQPAPTGDQPAPSGDQPVPGADTGGATASDPNAPQGDELTPEPEA